MLNAPVFYADGWRKGLCKVVPQKVSTIIEPLVEVWVNRLSIVVIEFEDATLQNYNDPNYSKGDIFMSSIRIHFHFLTTAAPPQTRATYPEPRARSRPNNEALHLLLPIAMPAIVLPKYSSIKRLRLLQRRPKGSSKSSHSAISK